MELLLLDIEALLGKLCCYACVIIAVCTWSVETWHGCIEYPWSMCEVT